MIFPRILESSLSPFCGIRPLVLGTRVPDRDWYPRVLLDFGDGSL